MATTVVASILVSTVAWIEKRRFESCDIRTRNVDEAEREPGLLRHISSVNRPFKPGRDRFHSVPIVRRNERDGVESVPA